MKAPLAPSRKGGTAAYIRIDPDDIKVNFERQENFDVLEAKVERPDKRGAAALPVGQRPGV